MTCWSTALDLFDQADAQQDILSNFFVDYHQITAITSNALI